MQVRPCTFRRSSSTRQVRVLFRDHQSLIKYQVLQSIGTLRMCSSSHQVLGRSMYSQDIFKLSSSNRQFQVLLGYLQVLIKYQVGPGTLRISVILQKLLIKSHQTKFNFIFFFKSYCILFTHTYCIPFYSRVATC